MSTAALWFDKTEKKKKNKTEGKAEIEGKHASMSPLLRFKLKFLLLHFSPCLSGCFLNKTMLNERNNQHWHKLLIRGS